MSVRSGASRTYFSRQVTTVTCRAPGEAYPEKKNAFASHPRGRALRLSARAPRAVDLEVALLAERRARGRDGQRMRFAASSSVDLGQHAGAAFASDGGRRCEVRRRAARPVDRREQRRRASCAARRQLERGRAGEWRAHRRLAGQAGLLRHPGVSHRHRRVLLCPPPRRTYGGPGTLRLRCVVCVMAALATRSSSSTAASSSSTATSQQQQQLKLLLQQQLCCTV